MKKSRLINYGKVDKNIIFPIISIIFIIVENTIFNKSNILENFYSHIFMICIGQSIGKILSFIPFIILNIINKNLSEENQIINNKLVYRKEYYEKYKRIKYKKYGLIILFSILNCLINILYYRVMLSVEFDYWLLDIIYIIIFSYLILKIKLYKHQYLSILIIFIAGLSLNIINSLNAALDYIIILLSILTEIVYCLNIIVDKYLMEYTFCSPYEICFYDGIISLIIFIVALAISTNTEIKDNGYAVNYKGKFYVDNFYDYYDKFNTKEFFLLIFEIIYYFTYYLFPLITIQNYTVYHYLLILIFDFEVTFLIDFEINWKFFLNIILFSLIFFMLLVFNEIIEINCFGFQKNTRKRISERAELDLLNINEISDDNEYIVVNDAYIVDF
jgi:hypothetical protein